MRLDDMADALAETLLELGVPQKNVDAFEIAAYKAERALHRLPFDQAADVLHALAHSFKPVPYADRIDGLLLPR